tara:strand:- start:1332 stop:1562 length:231 start_codon:yes stop_codon:yes gene_type:complete
MRGRLLVTSALVTLGAAFSPTKMTHGPVIRHSSSRDVKNHVPHSEPNKDIESDTTGPGQAYAAAGCILTVGNDWHT